MKNTMLKMEMPLVAATWVDALRRVCNRIALVAAAHRVRDRSTSLVVTSRLGDSSPIRA